MNNNYEKRILTNDNIEYRAYENEDGKRYIEGYASVFEHKSKILWDWENGNFYEIIERGAFDEVLKNEKLDVIFTPNHNFDKPLARTKNNTLQLSTNEKGLKFIAEINDTSDADDLYKRVKRGDIYECSFVFTVSGENQTWSEENNETIRRIKKVNSLIEVSSVTFGAYDTTDVSVAARSYKEYKRTSTDNNKITELEIDKMKLSILKLK